MKRRFALSKVNLLFLVLIVSLGRSYSQVKESFYPIKPIPFTEVEVTDRFWKERMETNREVTIPIAFERSEETGRIKNFKVAGGLEEGTFNTRRGYDDSDVYKVMEGAAYSLSQHPDSELEKYLDTLISYVGAAQEEDGYLFTVKTILGVSDEHRDAKLPRWVGVEKDGSHELYNVGHMYEAAVAHYRATGKRTFLDIAIKNADLVDKVFGWGKLEEVPGHQEIEVGLVKLYEVTGEKRYLDLAKFFLDKRGEKPGLGTYNQTHKKVVDQDKAVGHSVRAVYMYAGMADMAALTDDKAYVEAMDKLWHDIVDTKLYIIGGIGAAGGHEGFGDHYELPNLRAYNETCAAIANVFWNQRLFLTHGDAKYADVLERSMYNNVLSGVSLSGDEFFYPNRLESRGKTQRSQWFNTSCCPSNISRFLPDVPGYIYAHDKGGIYVNLFVSSKTNIMLGETNVEVSQISGLPWSGNVKLNVKTEESKDFSLKIRIPGWASERPVPSDLYAFKKPLEEKTKIKVNGENVDYKVDRGYAVVSRVWQTNDQVEVQFPYELRIVESHKKILENEGRVAIQLGPLVYCVEGKDLGSEVANNIMIDEDQKFSLKYEKDLFDGVITVNGKATYIKKNTSGTLHREVIDFKAIPYYAWANRGGSEMQVWIPNKESAVFPEPVPTKGNQATLTTSKQMRAGGLYLVNDSYKPTASPSIEVPHFNFWPLKNSTEWIDMNFDEPTTISESTVYWKNEEVGTKLPLSYKLHYKKGNKWKEIRVRNYPINPDGKPSTISFKRITTSALRLEITQGSPQAGLYEWEVM
ncbi:glycoside hydrolase family 127 protein [Seonamhaeicola sp.]|uniref:glycoside hydrolase family 127 protein n=1 Tax=Seonamhaeicola sp. TaxID=1912245 RepID=UPI0026313E0F|nr:glycoside hydrolase family 127 protein [Seonamhaeicola sp.]